MGYNVTDFQLTNEIQIALLETPNSGSSYSSGLYTSTEVAAALNYRLRDFYKRTGVTIKRSTDYSTNRDQVSQNLPNDVIDVVRVAYPDASGNVVAIIPGSQLEEDIFTSDTYGVDAAVEVPQVYTLDVSGVLQVNLLPPPDDSRTLDYVYVPQPTSLPTTPDGTLLECPTDFSPYIKYGALATLFGKSGETYDPMRAQVCEQFYELGIQVARQWVTGNLD